jgi:hypothetical protein
MNHGYIRLGEVLNQMDQFGPDNKQSKFQIRFVTADRSLGTGGEILKSPLREIRPAGSVGVSGG